MYEPRLHVHVNSAGGQTIHEDSEKIKGSLSRQLNLESCLQEQLRN